MYKSVHVSFFQRTRLFLLFLFPILLKSVFFLNLLSLFAFGSEKIPFRQYASTKKFSRTLRSPGVKYSICFLFFFFCFFFVLPFYIPLRFYSEIPYQKFSSLAPQELEVRSLNHPYSLKTKSSQCHYVMTPRSFGF